MLRSFVKGLGSSLSMAILMDDSKSHSCSNPYTLTAEVKFCIDCWHTNYAELNILTVFPLSMGAFRNAVRLS
jgi:hypothetical protein